MWQRVVLLVITGIAALGFSVATAVVMLDTENGGGDENSMAAGQPDGRNLFRTSGCTGCHWGPDATDGIQVGPDLRHLPDIAGERVEGMSAREYVRTSIVAPDSFTVSGYSEGVMPRLQLTTEEIEALVSYLLRQG